MTKTVVVGVACTPVGNAVLEWAADYARATGSRLRAVHVLSPRPEASVMISVGVALWAPVPDQVTMEEQKQRVMHQWDRCDPLLGWDLQFAGGHPGKVLVESSRDDSLLVVGTGEHIGLGRLVPGSVSHYCLSHACCTVVAVPLRRVRVTAVEPGHAPARVLPIVGSIALAESRGDGLLG